MGWDEMMETGRDRRLTILVWRGKMRPLLVGTRAGTRVLRPRMGDTSDDVLASLLNRLKSAVERAACAGIMDHLLGHFGEGRASIGDFTQLI